MQRGPAGPLCISINRSTNADFYSAPVAGFPSAVDSGPGSASSEVCFCLIPKLEPL
jgi:hypothetical protein